MDYSASEWSSGCESGWTGYFDESSLSSKQLQAGGKSNQSVTKSYKVDPIRDQKTGDDDEEEDLSMVSDASSGPPPHSQDYRRDDFLDPIPSGYHFLPALILPNNNDGSDQQKGKQHQHLKHSYLDDTATSPALNLSSGNSAYDNQFGFCKSTPSKTSDSAEPSQMRGKSTWK